MTQAYNFEGNTDSVKKYSSSQDILVKEDRRSDSNTLMGANSSRPVVMDVPNAHVTILLAGVTPSSSENIKIISDIDHSMRDNDIAEGINKKSHANHQDKRLDNPGISQTVDLKVDGNNIINIHNEEGKRSTNYKR